ncbi:GH92 family glycosyl hydrolase [Jonesiaceae bacterium BS-20]|uniref:GH92 family glycosyl hydrolase n=1 Tax=Jonesiaceae bacterium BS-20 TaxID=3120821 RepID=A0AAU7DUE2_9MICO
MTSLHSPLGAPRQRYGRTVAFTLAAALAGTTMVSTMVSTMAAAAPEGAADSTFLSSFEPGDPQPLTTTAFGDDQKNFNGKASTPGSILNLVQNVVASTESPAAEGPANLADGSANTKWLIREPIGHATYELSDPAAITGYTLTSANNASERDPKDFVVQGSIDGATWVDLDTQTGQTWTGRLATNKYELPALTEKYGFYRLAITANNGGPLLQIADWELLDSNRTSAASPMVTEISSGPRSSHTAKTNVGFSGIKALEYGGRVAADGDAKATNELFDIDVAVAADSQLSYKIFPVLDPAQTYAATHVAVDLVFDDGERLSADPLVTDAYGYAANASAQGQGNILWPDQWNSVTVDLGKFSGKSVKKVLVSYEQPGAPANTPVLGYIDDISIDQAEELDTSDGLISYVDTRRGTNSTGGFSRGNNIPAAAWPNGFNFITPMTNADNHSTIYHYQKENNASNLPGLSGIGFSHQPSIWMGDRNQLAVLPANGDSPSSSIKERRLPFQHENETARPDHYAVRFENNLTTSVTPTDHGAIYKFGFTGDTGSVIVDKVDGSSALTIAEDGTVSGTVSGGSGYPGRTQMFVYGEFDTVPSKAGATTVGNRNSSARFAAFDTSTDKEVELRIASSFISQEQAKKNFGLELEGVSYDSALTAVQKAWNDRLSVVTDVKGATDAELVTLYSSLYRLNLYPNSQFENTGTVTQPDYKYASPVSATDGGSASDANRKAKIVDGKMYVNNGFWDTYRTAWPAYAFLYPEQSEELVDGFIEQYREGGWVARWSSPGYADLMTGTSSDVAFAEAYLAGALSNSLALEAYNAALKNATVLPESNAVGRKGLDRSIFLGFTHKDTHESASWGLEGFINDFGIAQMAQALAEDPETPAERKAQLLEEAEYFEARSTHYTEMYNPEAGVFTARSADGTWPEGKDFNKKAWGGAFTEASGWTFAFHAPHDVDGLSALYGGRQGLLDEMNEFLTTPERADYSGIHEAREARDVRLGMLGMSNQIAHHIPYIPAAAGDPTLTQELVREIQQRLFAGSDIGQGYAGDEDNGEFSAWFIFSALGFYPLEVGSGNYTVGSPLFDSATLNINGKSLKINAPGAGVQNKIYVDGVTINGKQIDDVTFDGSLIRAGGTLDFKMSDTPSKWGAKDLNEKLEVPTTLVDAFKPGFGAITAADSTNISALVDDNMRSNVVFDENSTEITWKSASGPVFAHQYTVTSTTGPGVGTPESWILQGSTDGVNWTELDKRSGQEFKFNTQTRPFTVKTQGGAFTQFRLTLNSAEGTKLGLAELELFAKASQNTGLSVTGAQGLDARVDEVFNAPVATIIGAESSAAKYTVAVDFGDGNSATADNIALKSNGLSGWTVSAPHTYTAPGVYSVGVTVTDSSGATESATSLVVVSRDATFTGAFNNTCIGDLKENAANCDGQSSGYFRDKLADDGFIQGTTIEIPGTELTYDLPAVAPGAPDNVTGEGQTIMIDLGQDASQIALIGTATESGKQVVGTLNFSDGTTQSLPIDFGDWVGASGKPQFGNIVLAVSEGRLVGVDAEGSIKNTAIFATKPVALDTDGEGSPKTVVSLTMPQEKGTLRNDGRVHVFAFASDGDRASSTELVVAPAATEVQEAEVEFTTPLATVAGGMGQDAPVAVVNWGDGTTAEAIEVAGDAVSGTHTYAEAGTYTVWVTVDDGVRSVATQVEIIVEDSTPTYDPSVSIDAKVAQPGDSVTVTGTGYAPGESIEVTLGSSAPVTVVATAYGSFTAQVTVPADATSGDHPVVAVGQKSQASAQATLRVEVATPGAIATTTTLKSSVNSPVVGETFQLIATVTPADATGQVEFLVGTEVVGSAAVSAGSATTDLQAASSGTFTYTAQFIPHESDKFTESVSAALELEVRSAPVLEAEIELSAKAVAQGATVTVTGRGFAPGEEVDLGLRSTPTALGSATVNEDGVFKLDVTIPVTTELGTHTVNAHGTESDLSAEATLEVVAAGTGSGDGDGGNTDGDDAKNPDGELSKTGTNAAVYLSITLALLVTGGVFLFYRRKGLSFAKEN